MKAWLATDVVGLGAGLGKMDVVVVPRPNGNGLTVKVTRDGRVWIDEEIEGQPSPENGLQEIEIDDELAEKINATYDSRGEELSQGSRADIINLVNGALSM